MYVHKHTCRTTEVVDYRGRGAYIKNGQLDKGKDNMYAAIGFTRKAGFTRKDRSHQTLFSNVIPNINKL